MTRDTTVPKVEDVREMGLALPVLALVTWLLILSVLQPIWFRQDMDRMLETLLELSVMRQDLSSMGWDSSEICSDGFLV